MPTPGRRLLAAVARLTEGLLEPGGLEDTEGVGYVPLPAFGVIFACRRKRELGDLRQRHHHATSQLRNFFVEKVKRMSSFPVRTSLNHQLQVAFCPGEVQTAGMLKRKW